MMVMKTQWQEYCIVCGGPSICDSKHSWLQRMSAVTEESRNKVIALGRYDGHGAWEKHHNLLFRRKLHGYTDFATDFSRQDTYCAAFHDGCGKLLNETWRTSCILRTCGPCS
jgi:hypothetical protein